MDKIFEVELSYNGRDTRLLLPATPYELLDAAERLRLDKGENPSVEVLYGYSPFEELSTLLEDNCDLSDFNTLAQRLSALGDEEYIAFKGLVAVACAQKPKEKIPLAQLIDLAYSTDCCQVFTNVHSYKELGHFVVDNEIYPWLKKLPAPALSLLDYEELGKEYASNEGGLVIPEGFVAQDTELREIYKALKGVPVQPDYTILLELKREDSHVKLRLPTSLQKIEDTLNALGAGNWNDPFLHVQCRDCAAPILNPILGGRNGIVELNHLSTMLQQMDSKALTKFKATLEAVEDWSLQTAIHIASHLDDYILMDNYASPEDMARDFLAHDGQNEMIPFVDLAAYGNYLMENQNGSMGDYGMVMRGDGLPLQPLQQQTFQEEMTME